MVRTHFAHYGKVLSELAYNGSNTSGPENSLGKRDRRCGLPHYSLLLRARLAADDPDDPPAFDGLKVFPSLTRFYLTTIPRLGRRSCSDLPVRRCLSPPGSPHLPHSQEGYGVLINAEMSEYLWSIVPSIGPLKEHFPTYFSTASLSIGSGEAVEPSHHHFNARMPMNAKFRQIGSISRKPTCRNACLSSASVHRFISPRRLRSLSRSSFSLKPCSSLKS
jgi:hypothetical protein